MKRLILLTLFVLPVSISAFSQQPSNWERVVAVQKEERDAMYNRQESELKLLLQIQQASLEKVGTAEAIRADLAEKHIAERSKLSDRHSAERIELARLHNQERLGAQPKPVKPPEAGRRPPAELPSPSRETAFSPAHDRL